MLLIVKRVIGCELDYHPISERKWSFTLKFPMQAIRLSES